MTDQLPGAPVQALPSLKATLRYPDTDAADARDAGSVTGTLLGQAPYVVSPIDMDETVVGEAAAMSTPLASMDGVSARRTTVLPRRRVSEQVIEHVPERPRFDRVRVLGEGAIGEVELARDNDIRRTVAVKRLKDDVSSEAAVLRFADEVRIVGQLEHPSIVPIYDVGRDESGKIYLVMKHLHGDTMEQIIERMRDGDAATLEKFPLSHRVHLFLGVLDAIRYAHARGIVHRDLKPANIMIGPFGEVTVLDWGLAKKIERSDASKAEALDRTAIESADSRLLETRQGSLAGTPLYMSPEQAAGKNHLVDELSDTYALVMVLFEWLTLQHPLAKKTTVNEVLASIIATEYSQAELRDMAFAANVPMEYLQVCLKGLLRDREARFQSVTELEDRLRRILAGEVTVLCHVTLAKRATHEMIHWIDRHPMAYTLMFGGCVLGALGGAIYGLVRVVQVLI